MTLTTRGTPHMLHTRTDMQRTPQKDLDRITRNHPRMVPVQVTWGKAGEPPALPTPSAAVVDDQHP